MVTNFKIKRITSETELNGTSKVFQKTWQNAYKNMLPANELAKIKPDMWVNRLSRNDRYNLIAINTDNRVLGVVSYGNLRKNGQIVSDCGELMAIYVLPRFQGCGIGSKLLKNAENDLVKMNFKWAAL
ncbi:GNAT family N-acetyltransferase [Lactobacillus acetotolerans]|uniref:GNAT family N-acetyltransferase n=1 Tax=Lactobacillus acetotolerans TaxID=1600 RepID=UPI001451C810|nr:GNAT family N-acetyltransferase [Lactobacillus acetotolerans]QJD73154.1 GNAT family N-acetyltransferase [Lactobacillus acetotolerans]